MVVYIQPFLLLFRLFAHAHQLRSHTYPSTCLHINIDYTFCPEGASKARESLCKSVKFV